MRILINGQHDALVPPNDRGLAYGDGLFETIKVTEGRPEYWQAHMDRLAQGCRSLGFDCPGQDLLAQDAHSLLEGTVDQGVLKIIVTRGTGGRGYRPPEAPQPNRIVSLHEMPDSPLIRNKKGVAIRLCETRLATQPRLAGLKHLNRLEQVLARNEWDDPNIAEGLMLDQDDILVEGVMTNLFWFEGDKVMTPDLSACGVAGIMRGQILFLCEELGWPVEMVRASVERLKQVDGVFLSNSLIGLRPVTHLVQELETWAIPESERLAILQEKQEERRKCSSGF